MKMIHRVVIPCLYNEFIAKNTDKIIKTHNQNELNARITKGDAHNENKLNNKY